jgi:CRISPR-associated protein Csm5
MNVYAGPPRALTRITLRLVPLTPIHIGDGTEMRLDEYLLDGGALCRFDQAKAMRAMTPPQRRAFQQALDSSRLGEAAKALREAGSDAIIERIPISPRSTAELKTAFDNPLSRSGQVKPFVRSGGKPYIPGSSIKGAFRTALASAALPREGRPADSWTHETALQAAFGLDSNRTETDPLRFLYVSDAFLPEGATLIDKTEVVKPGGEPASAPRGGGGIQMHYERTLSLMDEDNPPDFDVALDVDGRASSAGGVRRAEARFDARAALSRLRAFHVGLFNAEMKRFFEGNTKQRLLRALLAHRDPAGRQPLHQQAWNPDFVLLRLGRFGHFESKSLEGVRRGHFPQARNPADKTHPPNAWGATRTVIRDAKGNPIPFGWVIGWVVKEERA